MRCTAHTIAGAQQKNLCLLSSFHFIWEILPLTNKNCLFSVIALLCGSIISEQGTGTSKMPHFNTECGCTYNQAQETLESVKRLFISVPNIFSFRRRAPGLTCGDLLVTSWIKLKQVDLHRHIIHQINGRAKPDFVMVVPDPYDQRRRRRRRKRARRQHPEPQEPPHIDILYIKMILTSSPTSG